MTDRPYHVLYLCTGNSARSILAEAITNRLGSGRFRSFSAGSQPKGEVNPHTLALLAEFGYDTSGLRSKSWTEFAGPDAQPMDFIFTVCDSAAGETCPLWPGHPASAHWGLPDPAAMTGSEAAISAAFADTYHLLEQRIRLLVDLPLDRLKPSALRSKLREIGAISGATALAREQAF